MAVFFCQGICSEPNPQSYINDFWFNECPRLSGSQLQFRIYLVFVSLLLPSWLVAFCSRCAHMHRSMCSFRLISLFHPIFSVCLSCCLPSNIYCKKNVTDFPKTPGTIYLGGIFQPVFSPPKAPFRLFFVRSVYMYVPVCGCVW